MDIAAYLCMFLSELASYMCDKNWLKIKISKKTQ